MRLTTVAVVASVLITACGPTLDIPKTQRLDRELPQYIAFDRPADQVWEALRAEAAARATCGVRGESRPDRVISWCERVRKWRDLGQDAVVARDGGKGDPDLGQKDEPKAVAITTAWVEQSTTGERRRAEHVRVRQRRRVRGRRISRGHRQPRRARLRARPRDRACASAPWARKLRRAVELEQQRATWTAITSSIVSAAIQAPLGVAVPGAIAQSVVDKVVGVGGFAGEFASRAATKVSDALVVSVVTQIKSGYSQASETEADRLAVSYMQRAGYDPRAALSVARTFSAWHEE